MVVWVVELDERGVILLKFLDTGLESGDMLFKYSGCGGYRHFVVLALFRAIESKTLVALRSVTVAFLFLMLVREAGNVLYTPTIFRRLVEPC